MKSVLFAFAATVLVAPAFAQSSGCYSGCTTPPPPPPTTSTGIWTGGNVFGNGSTFGNAFTNGSDVTSSLTGTQGFSDVFGMIEMNVSNCGGCATGDFNGRISGYGETGQRSVSAVTAGRYAEGGTLAQISTSLGGDWNASRGPGSMPMPAPQPSGH